MNIDTFTGTTAIPGQHLDRVDQVAIWRLVPPDESDDGQRSWIYLGSAACHFRPAGRVWLGIVPAGDVAVKDRLLVEQSLFDVVGILGPGSGHPGFLQIVCREISLQQALEAESDLALSA